MTETIKTWKFFGETFTLEQLRLERDRLRAEDNRRSHLVLLMRTRVLTPEESALALDYGTGLMFPVFRLSCIERAISEEEYPGMGWTTLPAFDEQAFHNIYLQQARLRAIEKGLDVKV